MNKDTQDPEQRWRVLLEAARQLIDQRDTPSARGVLREAMKYADETWGEGDVHLIDALHLMAESFWREHHPLDPNNESEVECLQRALAIARRRLPPDHLEIASLGGFLGSYLIVSGRIDEGCGLMLECLEIAHKNASEDDFSRYNTGIGYARLEQGRPAEALPFFERAAVVHERRDPSSIGHAITRGDLGKCLLAVGRNQEALDQLQLALRILDVQRVHGKHAGLMNEIMELIESVRIEKTERDS